MGKARNFNFGAQIDLSMSHLTDTKIPSKGAWWEMGLAKVYPNTEFEVSSFNHSRFMEGGLKFKNSALDLDHTLLGTFCRP